MADERGRKLADAMFGPAFGFFPQMQPKRSKQDPEAAKNVPIDVARGFAAGALGAPGDIESLIRLLPGLDKKTILPTSEEILQRIPGGSDTPTSRAVAGAGTLAGGFYTGPGSGVRAALSLPSAIKRAGQDFAMAAGQSGSKIFIGPKAKTWNQAAADLAVQLEKAGADPVDIWRQTGTFRGADGIQRQEISDVGVIHRNPDQLKELGKNKLEEARELGLRLFGTPGQKDLFPKALTEAKKPVREQVKRLKEEVDELNRHSGYYGQRAKFALEHPELYKAYPELADIPVTQGTYDHGVRGSLRGGPSDMEMSVTWAGLQSDPRSTMLHEMQHAVQTLEDMAPGGSPAMAFQDPRAYEILERMRLEIKKPVSFEQFQIISKYPDENEARSAYEKYLKILASSPIERSIDIDLQKQAAMEYYNRLAGEAEARATQAREPMGPTERRQEFPYSSYDVLPEDLIVKPPKQSMAHGGPVHFSNSPDTMRLELAGGGAVKMNQGGASFGQYTTGKKYQAARQRAQESGAAEVIEGGLRGLFGLDPQEGAGARGMEAYRNMAAASSSPTPLALAAIPAGVTKSVKKSAEKLPDTLKQIMTAAEKLTAKLQQDNPKLTDIEAANKAVRFAEKMIKWEKYEKPELEAVYGALEKSKFDEPLSRRQKNVPEVVQKRIKETEEFLKQPTEPWTPPRKELQAFDRERIKDALEGFPGIEQTKFPRYKPPRADIGYISEIYDDPVNRALIKGQIQRGLPLGGETFYASLYPLKLAALEKGIPESKFNEFIYSIAPASARNSIMNEMAVGQFMRDMKARGLPLDEATVTREMAEFGNKYGVGLPLMPVHREGVKNVLEGQQDLREMLKADIPTNYKIPTYGTQKAGDFGKSVVLDVHEAAGQTRGSPYHPYFTEQGGFGSTEYGAAENKMLDIANEMGIPGGMAQAGRWFGGGELTGLKSPRGDALDLLEKQAAYTLNGMGIKPTPQNVREYVLNMIEKGEGVLMPWFKKEGMPDVRVEKKKGGKVSFTDNPDVMRLELQEGGAAFGKYTTGKKYQAAKKRAEQADVNLLPDPKTYAAVMGLLGSPPDKLGFSVLHPEYEKIKNAGEAAFVAGTALTLGLGARPALEVAKQGARAFESKLLNEAIPNIRAPFTPATLTVEATAPDLGQGASYGYRLGLNDVLLDDAKKLYQQPNKLREAVGTYKNRAGELEVNPMLAVDIPFAGKIGEGGNRSLRQAVSQAGVDLNQEAMAAHRFIPLTTNNIADASAMLINTKQGLSKEQIKKLAERLGSDMVVSHNPRLGGVVVYPFGEVKRGQIPSEFLSAQGAAQEVLGKNAKIQYGKADINRDRLFIGSEDYFKEGARPMSAEQAALRERLQAQQKFAFPEDTSGIPGNVKASPIGGLQPWSRGKHYPTHVIGIGDDWQAVNFLTGETGKRTPSFRAADEERQQMLESWHRTLPAKAR